MKLEVGKIVKSQGIKGEVKMECFLDNPQMLRGVELLYVGVNAYVVEKLRPDGMFCYVKFAGISDRNAADTLRDWTVFADKDSISLPDKRYFVSDLVGCKVVLDNGSVVGTVTDILQYGAADVFVCNGAKSVSFPFLKDLVRQVNLQSKVISLDAKRFAEVALYED